MNEATDGSGDTSGSADRVNQILAAYALPAPLRWETVGGRFPHVYRVAAGSGEPSHYLKCYPPGHVSLADVLSEVDLVNTLYAAGVRVAPPVADRTGAWVTPAGAGAEDGCAVLFTKAPGRTFKGNELSSHQCQSLGGLAARVHGAMDRVPMHYPRRHMDLATLADGPLWQIAPRLDQAQRAALGVVVSRLKVCLGGLSGDTVTPAYGLCHGDLDAANVAFDDHDQPTLFDFQEFEYGWRAYDLAQFLWSIGRSWSDPDRHSRIDRWEAFVAGYNSVRPLSGAELRAAPVFVPLRLIWYMAFRLGRSPQSIGPAYFSTRIDFLEAWMGNFALG